MGQALNALAKSEVGIGIYLAVISTKHLRRICWQQASRRRQLLVRGDVTALRLADEAHCGPWR